MNERWKELLEEAHSRKPTMVIDHQTGQAVQATFRGEKMFRNEFDPEKFAELIVRECAHLVGGYTKENEFGTDVKEAYEEITKHFGVEE